MARNTRKEKSKQCERFARGECGNAQVIDVLSRLTARADSVDRLMTEPLSDEDNARFEAMSRALSVELALMFRRTEAPAHWRSVEEMRKRGYVAKRLIRAIELKKLEADGNDNDELLNTISKYEAIAHLIKSAILKTTDLDGLTIGLADYLCRAIDGSTIDVGDWDVLDDLVLSVDGMELPPAGLRV